MVAHDENDEDRSGPDIKVSDRRMFTPSGELREEYRDLEESAAEGAEGSEMEEAAAPAGAEDAPSADATAAATAESMPPPEAPGGRESTTGAGGGEAASAPGQPGGSVLEGAGEESPSGAAGGRPIEMPGTPGDVQQLSFLDLLGALAEPAAAYLGDAELPGGQDVTDLRLARHYIDLLDVLRRKTAGNLSAQESTVLEDLLYRLRMRYVQKQE